MSAYAGIAQLVERNLAKVEVASSVSFPAPCSDRPHLGVLSCQGYVPGVKYVGLMAEWLCTRLQIRLQRFDSA